MYRIFYEIRSIRSIANSYQAVELCSSHPPAARGRDRPTTRVFPAGPQHHAAVGADRPHGLSASLRGTESDERNADP